MSAGGADRLIPLIPLASGDLARLLDADGAPADAVSRGVSHSVSYDAAVQAADLNAAAAELAAVSTDGVIDWRRFDVTRFAALMPSLAYLDRIDGAGGADGAPDFIYRFVGETIEQIARRRLRGKRISEILVGEARQTILREYAACLAARSPRASVGRVVVSDMTWLRYLRILYPVASDGETPDRVLLFMLFAQG